MKKNLTKAIAFGLMFAMTGTATAFAQEPVDTEEETAVPPDWVAEASAGEDFAWKEYITQTGKIASVEEPDEDGVRIVTMDNEQGGLRFALGGMTPVLDRETEGYLTADGLEEGMEVAVVYDAGSPMGMSLPPYLGSVTAVVANADKGFYMVGHFDGELTDAENRLQLNISEETNILNTMGTRLRMAAEDIQGQDALVFYGMTTRSIPAQTTPSLVLVLAGTHEDAQAEDPTDAPEQGDEGPAIVPLRKTAEAMGWKVTWQGKAQPVLLEKDGVSIEVSVGADTFVVDGDMVMQAQVRAELRDGVMFVSNEVFEAAEK